MSLTVNVSVLLLSIFFLNPSTFALFADANKDANGQSNIIKLPGASCSATNRLALAWSSAFEAKYHDLRMSLTKVGAETAERALWGDIDCELDAVEEVCTSDTLDRTLWGIGNDHIHPEFYEDHTSLKLQQFPVAIGAVAVVYSREVCDNSDIPLRLTFETISGIFNSTIRYWDDPMLQVNNPSIELPHKEISVIARTDSSGVSYIFTRAIGQNIPSWPKEAVGSKPIWPLGELKEPENTPQSCSNENFTEVKSIGAKSERSATIEMLRNPYNIGYLEEGAFVQFAEFIRQAEVSNPAHPDSFVALTPESIAVSMESLTEHLEEGTLELDLARAETPVGGYPISGSVYIYLKKSHTEYISCYQAWLLCMFVKWIYTDQQAHFIAIEHNWVVPPESVARKALQFLEEVECLNTEYDPPKVIPALSYKPLPQPTENEESDGKIVIIFLSAVSVFLLIFIIIQCIGRKERVDIIAKIRREDLVFEEPFEVIGRGRFGVVLLADYRGTRVAVKRLLPPRLSKPREGSSMFQSMFTKIAKGQIPGESSFSTSIDGKILPSDPWHDLRFEDDADSKMSGSMHSRGFATSSGFYSDKSNDKGSSNLFNKDFLDEIKILSKLQHPCITTVVGAVLDKSEPLLVMEYMEHGSLYDILKNETMLFDEEMLCQICQDIVRGLQFLHTATPQIIHCDLKSRNILVDRHFRAKLCDFGLSNKSKDGISGTPFWMAPELHMRKSTNTTQSDIYSFGILMFEAWARKEPYENEDPQEILKQIIDPAVNRRPPVPNNMTAPFSALMQDCLVSDPKLRPSAEEAGSRLKQIESDGIMPNPSNGNANVSLFDIFPTHIAEALEAGRKVEPEYKSCVTIFFSDIVGYTNLSSTLTPAKVCDLLDRLYTEYDALSDKHDLYKVETIGDSYMAVANLVKDQSQDHAKRVAQFAVDTVKASNNTLVDLEDPSKGYVNIRVGFHSGPVVANVVGNRNPRYCLFGDTVNTASSMESNSEKNRIQCSRSSYELLQDQAPEIPIDPRGRINIKGKGVMSTFWVNEKATFFAQAFSEDQAGKEADFLAYFKAEVNRVTELRKQNAEPADEENPSEVKEEGEKKVQPKGISVVPKAGYIDARYFDDAIFDQFESTSFDSEDVSSDDYSSSDEDSCSEENSSSNEDSSIKEDSSSEGE